MPIYYVNGQGEKIDPNAAPPLSPVFTVNTDDKGHEAFLKQLKGEVPEGVGVVRLTSEHGEPSVGTKPETDADAPRRGRPPSAPLR